MLKLDEICRNNGFRYSIIFGTLLGAIRHKGFIPWDDDIDIAMYREDYNALRNYIVNHKELKLNFIDYTTQDTIYMCGKVCDNETIIREGDFKKVDNYGIFVDVFILENLPDDIEERKKFKKHALYLARLIQHSSRISPGRGKNLKQRILRIISFLYTRFVNTKRVVEKLDLYNQKYSNIETKYCGVPYFKSVFLKSDFEKLVELPFENYYFMGPQNFDNVLRASYKDPYTLPPEDKRYTHRIECYLKE